MTLKKVLKRDARKERIRRKVEGTAERPRLAVFRSLKHIYAQVIDDSTGETLVSASTVDKTLREELAAIKPAPVEKPKAAVAEAPAPVAAVAETGKKKGKGAEKEAPKPEKKEKKEPAATRNILIAKRIGEVIAERCKAKQIDKVVFDRAGYKYHGRVKTLAEAARKAGLQF